MTDTQEQINELIALKLRVLDLQTQVNFIEWELQQQMERDKATAIPHPTHKVELKKTLAYDPSKLAALRELIDPKELESSGAFTPEHEETRTVLERWNMTKVKPFGKYAGVKAVIKDAAFVASTRLNITEKK